MDSNSVLLAGETLIDMFPGDNDPSIETDVFTRRAGGAPANVAAGVAKLDSPPFFWTSVGDDRFGRYLRSRLEQTAISPRFIYERDNASTGIALVDDTVDGGFELYIDGTATVNFDIDELPETIFANVEWVHLGGVLLAREPARSAMFDLIQRAGRYDCTLSFDPNVRPSIWPSAEERITSLNRVLERVDVVVGHMDDFSTGTFPTDPTALADELLDRGASVALITKGAAGAEIKTRSDSPWGEHHDKHPGFDIDVTDTTGAGDAFTAAAIVSLREHSTPPADVLRFANACGAITTTQTGAIPALPDRSTLRTWLQDHG